LIGHIDLIGRLGTLEGTLTLSSTFCCSCLLRRASARSSRWRDTPARFGSTSSSVFTEAGTCLGSKTGHRGESMKVEEIKGGQGCVVNREGQGVWSSGDHSKRMYLYRLISGANVHSFISSASLAARAS